MLPEHDVVAIEIADRVVADAPRRVADRLRHIDAGRAMEPHSTGGFVGIVIV